jgi:hypothetical protein
VVAASQSALMLIRALADLVVATLAAFLVARVAAVVVLKVPRVDSEVEPRARWNRWLLARQSQQHQPRAIRLTKAASRLVVGASLLAARQRPLIVAWRGSRNP